MGHHSFAEFHDAHRVRWHAVIGKYEFSDPEIAAADHSPDRKSLLVRLDGSAFLNVVPAANPFARLRIIKHSILAVYFVLDFEIARVRGIPMPLQRCPYGSIVHVNLPRALRTLIPGLMESSSLAFHLIRRRCCRSRQSSPHDTRSYLDMIGFRSVLYGPLRGSLSSCADASREGTLEMREPSSSRSRRGLFAMMVAPKTFIQAISSLHRLHALPSGPFPSVRNGWRRHGRGSRCCALWLMRALQALRDRHLASARHSHAPC